MWRLRIIRPALLGILATAFLSAAEPVTLTDTDGRSIVGQVLEISDTQVRFQISDRQPASIPLARLSEGSRAILLKMKGEGLLPAGTWPVRGSISVPYKFKAEGGVLTGNNVRLVFPYTIKPVASSPEVAFLMSVDTAIAAAKAIPLGLIEKNRIFECRVVRTDRFIAMAKARREKLSPPLAHLFDGGPGGSGTRLAGSRALRLTPQVHYDEDADVLYVTSESLDEFLSTDLGAPGTTCPLPERHRIIREAAVKMAFGKNHHRIPVSLRSAWAGYFATIDSVTGADLDYGKLSAGLRKLVQKGVPLGGLEHGELIKFDPEAAVADLAAGRIPEGNNGILVIYYLLHLDDNRKASSLGTLLRTSLPEDDAIRLACDNYRAEVAAFKDKAEAYNRALYAYHSKGGGPYTKPRPDNPPPIRPIPPPASLEDFLESTPMLALAIRAESKRLQIILRNRSSAEVAADFDSVIGKAAR